MARSLAQRYYPEPTPIDPKDWPRYMDQELTRIADRFNQPPVYGGIEGDELFPIGVVPFTIILGTEGVSAVNDNFGAWNGATGEYTIPQTGLWQLQSRAFIQAFGAGNKTYEAKLEMKRAGAVVATMIQGGSDDVSLGISLPTSFVADQGQIMTLELTASHENQTANTPYFYTFSYLRLGDI